MQIFKIWISWNFPNWKIEKFRDFIQFRKSKFDSKNWQFWNRSIIHRMVNSWDINIFPNCSILKKFYSSNFTNCKFLEFSNCKFLTFEFFGILLIGKLRNFEILFNLENQSLTPKIGNFGIVHPFDIAHYSQFRQFSHLSFDINQFQRFNFLTFISYSSGNFLDWQIHKIIKFLKLLKNLTICKSIKIPKNSNLVNYHIFWVFKQFEQMQT